MKAVSSWFVSPDSVRPLGVRPKYTKVGRRARSCTVCSATFLGYGSRLYCTDACRRIGGRR